MNSEFTIYLEPGRPEGLFAFLAYIVLLWVAFEVVRFLAEYIKRRNKK